MQLIRLYWLNSLFFIIVINCCGIYKRKRTFCINLIFINIKYNEFDTKIKVKGLYLSI